ncbi:hypothetical protein, partial [Streptomyces sp. HG99]
MRPSSTFTSQHGSSSAVGPRIFDPLGRGGRSSSQMGRVSGFLNATESWLQGAGVPANSSISPSMPGRQKPGFPVIGVAQFGE